MHIIPTNTMQVPRLSYCTMEPSVPCMIWQVSSQCLSALYIFKFWYCLLYIKSLSTCWILASSRLYIVRTTRSTLIVLGDMRYLSHHHPLITSESFFRLITSERLTACSFGLSVTSQQYFSLRTNQPPAISQQYFLSEQISTSHQPPAKRTGCETVPLCMHARAYAWTVLFRGTGGRRSAGVEGRRCALGWAPGLAREGGFCKKMRLGVRWRAVFL
jgi:hypothetical protein